MFKVLFFLILYFINFLVAAQALVAQKSADQIRSEIEMKGRSLYRSISGVSSTVSETAFVNAYLGQQLLIKSGKARNWPELGVIDMNKASGKKRFLVVDLNANRTLISTQVAHGKNSGGTYPKSFSNVNNSLKSSLGFYEGANSYSGKYGYSLRYNGLDSYYNSRVMSRAIVLHKAWYVRNGYAGRSYGCTAVNRSVSTSLVNLLKNGRILYVHHDSFSRSKSTVLQSSSLDSSEVNYAPSTSEAIEIDSNPVSFDNMEQFSNARTPTIAAAGGVVLLGGALYKSCQSSANDSWSNTVAKVKNGESTDSIFRSSWGDKQREIEEIDGDVTIDQLKEESTNHLKHIKDCTALAGMSSNTDFNKESLDSPDSTAALDGSVECTYRNSQSQDYTQCQELVNEYNKLLVEEKELNESHTTEFSQTGNESVKALQGSNSIQVDSLSSAEKLNSLGNRMSVEAAELNSSKVSILKAIRDKLPNKESILNECQSHMSRVTGIFEKDFLAFSSQFDENISIVPNTGDSCERAFSESSSEIIQNDAAKFQANEQIIKLTKKGSDDYEAALFYRKMASLNNGMNKALNSSSSGFGFGDSSSSSENNSGLSEKGTFGANGLLNNDLEGSNLENDNALSKRPGTVDDFANHRGSFNNHTGHYGEDPAASDMADIDLSDEKGEGRAGLHSGEATGGIYNDALADREDHESSLISNKDGNYYSYDSVEDSNSKLEDITTDNSKSIFDIISLRYRRKISNGVFQ